MKASRLTSTLGISLWLGSAALLASACGSDGSATVAESGVGGTSSDASSADGTTDTSDSTTDGSASSDGSGGTSSGTADGTADGSGGTAGSGGSGTNTTDTATTGAGGTFVDTVELCGGVCQCGNGIDDDGDGKIDGFDEECTGAGDDDEGSFATGVPGDNRDPIWQDCFFDGNSGAGDDKCRYHTDCLTGDLPADDPDCTVSDDCVAFCGERTPNGCDCFGCCEVDTPEGTVNIYIIDTCDLENIDDEDACPRCEPSDQCGNDCGECELCPGKDTLPESCEDNTPQCDDGREPCDETTPCADNYFCQFGCCAPPPTIG